MRFLLALVLAWVLCGHGKAAISAADLKQFAQRYAAAVKSRDVAKIQAFFLPALFTAGPPSDQQAVARWLKSFKEGLLPENDPVWIEVKTLPPNPPLMAMGKWKARPQYTIEIQSHHPADGGQESNDGIVETVCEEAGHLYIVRPLPN